MSDEFPRRPFLPADTMALRDLVAQSIEELTADDYDEDQRLACVASAADADGFRARLGGMLTLVVQLDGEYLGFGSLKDNKTIDMLYVHPDFAGEGVGSAIADALEKIAGARGAEAVTVDASDTAVPFFEDRGYTAVQRNSVPRDDQWLSNTTMIKPLKDNQSKAPPPAKPS
jgi:putative acetyltransferase